MRGSLCVELYEGDDAAEEVAGGEFPGKVAGVMAGDFRGFRGRTELRSHEEREAVEVGVEVVGLLSSGRGLASRICGGAIGEVGRSLGSVPDGAMGGPTVAVALTDGDPGGKEGSGMQEDGAGDWVVSFGGSETVV